MTAVLEVQDAARRFGEVQALDGVSFAAGAGEAVGLLGPNGSGKSTLIRCIVTLERLDSGSILVDGADVAAQPARARQSLGYAGQEFALDKVLTGRELLRFTAGIVHLPRPEIAARVDEMLGRLDLLGAADRRIEGYSGGMKRRLDLAASLLHRPALLILDEPSSGLDLEARRRLWSFLRDLRRDGTTLLVATHDFEEADVLCDRLLLMSAGRVTASGSPQLLRNALGSFVLGASLHEHPQEGDTTRLEQLFHGIPGRPLPPDARRAELDWVLPAGVGEHDVQAFIARAQERAHALGMPLFSLVLRKPTLEDVYRAAVRGLGHG